jgi:lipopolysaccharide exporter
VLRDGVGYRENVANSQQDGVSGQEPSRSPLGASVKRGVAWSTLSFGLSKGLSFLAVLVLARLLAPSQFGLVAAVLVVLSLIELTADLGMKATVIYEQESGASDRVETAFTLNMIVATTMTWVGVLIAPVVADFFHVPEHAGLFRLAMFDVFLTGLGTTHDGLLLRDLRFNTRIVTDVLNAAVRAVVGVTLALSGFGAASLVWGFLAGTAAWTIAQWSLTPFRPRLRLDRRIAASMMHYAAGASMLTVLDQLYGQVGPTAVGRVLGARALGLYSIAYRVPTLLLQNIANQISQVAFPALARKRVTDAAGVGASTHRLIRYQSLYALPLAAGMAVLARPLVGTIFSARWLDASGVLAAVAILSGISASLFPLGDGFKALARQRVMVVLAILQLPLALGLIILVAPYGITAVAWVQVGGELFVASLMVVTAQRVLGVPIRSTLAALWPGSVAAVGVVAGAGAVRTWSGLPPLLELIAGTVIGAVGAVIALALLSPGTLRQAWSLAAVVLERRSRASRATTVAAVSSLADQFGELQPDSGPEPAASTGMDGAHRAARRPLQALGARVKHPGRAAQGEDHPANLGPKRGSRWLLGPRGGASRPRHDVPRAVFLALRPLFRYSYQHEAWILVGVGERYGPVLRSPDGELPAEAPAARYGQRREAPLRPDGIRPRLRVLWLSGILITALLGFTFARATVDGHSPPAPDKHVSAGLLQVTFPSGWRRQTPRANPQLSLNDELALAPASGGGMLVIGRTTTADSDLLPQSLLASLTVAPRPQTVTLGKVSFYRYLNLSPRGQNTSETVYATPTTVGTVLGVCLTRHAPPGFAASCELALASLRLASGTVLALGPSSSYAAGLNAVLSKLNAVRSSAGSQLRSARDASAQARAAEVLAGAHAAAASALLRLDAGTATAANSAVATALRMTADAYRALARAAVSGDAGGYSAASESLTRAANALESALARLNSLGYQVR